MQRKFDIIKTALISFHVSFVRNSFFYRLSLDKRSGIFSSESFIDDPWPGDAMSGRNILNSKRSINSLQIDIVDFLQYKPVSNEFVEQAKYANSFFWVRDLQAVGGSNSRKYARKLISIFIDSYRGAGKFWNRKFQWDNSVIGERICNWILSHAFVASGASDDFQKKFLSSLCEQYSHLLKGYKAESRLVSRLLALKGLIFCQCVMKNVNIRLLRRFIKELDNIFEIIFYDSGMVSSRNPVELFNIFRSILEIRFITRSLDLMNSEVWVNRLSRIATCIRFLRFGDGGISQFSGDTEFSETYIKPTRQIIDAAISVVDINNSDDSRKILGFERLATKKAVVLVNTAISSIRSSFNPQTEPGLNIFDIEMSFGIDKIIYRADIAVLYNGFRLKVPKNSKTFSRKNIKKDGISFEGEMQNFSAKLPFAIRRELFLSSNKPKMSCTDFIFMNFDFSANIRFVLNKDSKIKKTNENNVLISISSREYKLRIVSGENIGSIVIKDNDIYPTVDFEIQNCNSNEIQIEWLLEQLDN